MIRSVATAACVIVMTAWSPAAAQSGTSGIARAKDGDSLMVGQTEVRLFGIDAPELHQTCQRDGRAWACGAEAAARLASLVNGKSVSCEKVDTDQYRRTVARCRVGSMDVNRAMVALGYAVAYRHYSSDYVSAEESARVSRRGLWSGTFTLPSEYRHAERTLPELRDSDPPMLHRSGPARTRTVAGPTGACNIKGNRNRKGQWIYHVPGMPCYEQTRAEEVFCTEQQARAAGYRRAIVR